MNKEFKPCKTYIKARDMLFSMIDNPLHNKNLYDVVIENDMKWCTFNRIFGSESFVNWFNSELEAKTNSKEWIVWKQLFGLIERKDYKAIELYFKLKGKLVNKEQDHSNQTIILQTKEGKDF